MSDASDIDPPRSAPATCSVSRLQFSLRGLFIVMTLAAAAAAFAANYPSIAGLCLLWTIPFFSGRFMVFFIHHAPFLARLILIGCALLSFTGTAFLVLLLYRGTDDEPIALVAGIAMSFGYGAFCGALAWAIPGKRRAALTSENVSAVSGILLPEREPSP
jgi:hypothetical protein